MQRGEGVLKSFLYAAVIFLTLGISIANEALSRFGLQENYIFLFSIAFVLAAFMLGRNIWMMLLLVAGVAAVNLPEVTLMRFSLDRDVILALLCALVLVPSVYELISS